MLSEHAAWLEDCKRYDEAVKPYLETTEDGWTYVSDRCPADLMDSYSLFVSMSYAKGYLRP